MSAPSPCDGFLSNGYSDSPSFVHSNYCSIGGDADLWVSDITRYLYLPLGSLKVSAAQELVWSWYRFKNRPRARRVTRPSMLILW
jgi:hypothetical protein